MAKDCDFEVDYTLAEVEAVNDFIEQFDEIKDREGFPAQEQVVAMANTQRLLKNIERRLLYSYKIPLSEETRRAFHEIQAPVTSVDEFVNNSLPSLSHALLNNMLNNYCVCRSANPNNPGPKEVDIRKGYDEMAEVEGGTLYRKGGTIQVWWGPGWGKETWNSDEANAKRNFVDMKERWS